MKKSVRAAVWAALVSPLTALAMTFTAGHVYSTSDSSINEYSSTGQLLSSFNHGAGNLRGLGFGADGLMYVVQGGWPNSATPKVQALDASGNVVRSYAFTGLIDGNISYGKISFDASGQNFYVGAANGIYKFNVGSDAGTLFKNVDAFDIKVLTNGDLLVGRSNAVDRYSSTGQLLSSVGTLADPLGLSGDNNPFLSDVRGVEYDAASQTTFVTMLGYWGTVNMGFKVLALSGHTNNLVGLENYWYGDDMFVTAEGKLLVGSRTLPPGMFTSSLEFQGSFNGPEARFVTALPVPEPSTVLMTLAGLVLVARRVASARKGATGA